ncbi:leukocyte receptor cluster member 1 [Diaphorina citri]|uniref:Leukocyte receptor cluster member 1 n=1 Tax=Diaphorina citri TaxID=121845 RepID=A0A1S3D3K7_DIACI|nr:leukocyte receptor cluster member 1 [Diaphorina citri]
MTVCVHESEARTTHLREKAKEKFYKTSSSSSGKKDSDKVQEHINLFRDIQEGRDGYKKTNEEHEKEEKEVREKYEKSIGYLTYLGQDTKVTAWYQTKRLRDGDANNSDERECQKNDKVRYDPLNVIQRVVGVQKPCKAKSTSRYENQRSHEDDGRSKHKKRKESDSLNSSNYNHNRRKRKHKHREYRTKPRNFKKRKHAKSSGESEDSDRNEKIETLEYRTKPRKSKKRKRAKISEESESESEDSDRSKKIEILRQERLKREAEEKVRAEKVLAKLRGESIPDGTKVDELRENGRKKQKYNSQYNPTLAKQNKD